MPTFRSVAKVGVCVSTFGLCMFVLFQASVHSQESRNLLNNGGFEGQLPNVEFDWQRGVASADLDTENIIELENALALTHGTGEGQNEICQKIRPETFIEGERYVLSANTKIESNNLSGQAFIRVRFHGDKSLDQMQFFDANGDTAWRKISLHFEVPGVPNGGTKSLRVFLGSQNASLGTNQTTFFDHVQLLKKGRGVGNLLDGNDAVINGDFEDENGLNRWNTDNGGQLETNPNQSNSGTNSIKIVGIAGSRYTTQYIPLTGNDFEPDEPVYTVSANIRTKYVLLGDVNQDSVVNFLDISPFIALLSTGQFLHEADINCNGIVDFLDISPFIALLSSGDSVPPAPAPADANTNIWDGENLTLPAAKGRGANIQIACHDADNPDTPVTRILAMPFFRSKSGTYHERKFSFLVPQGTDGLILTLHVFRSKGMVAHFDDVRLVKNDVVDTLLEDPQEGLIRNVGHRHNVVEAPEVGTSVNVNDYPGIQAAIEEVSDVTNPNFGKIVWVPAGTYNDYHEIFLRSGVHLKMHKDAVFLRQLDDDSETSMWHGAFLKNEVWASPISDVIVEGGVYDNSAGSGGSPLAICGDRVACRSFNILSYTQKNIAASALYFLGHDVLVHHNTISGPVGFRGIDGIHLWGGGRAHIMCNDVFVGDDGIGLYTGEDPTIWGFPVNQVIYNRNIVDVECFNNRLDSAGARAFACGLVSFAAVDDQPRRLTSKVENVRCRNFVGRCGGENAMIAVDCAPLTNARARTVPFGDAPAQESQVRNILIQNGNVKGSRYTLTGGLRPPRGLTVFTTDVGSVEDVLFQNIKVSNVESHFGPDGTLQQASVILEVRKSRWDLVTDPDTGEFTVFAPEDGHNNKNVRFEDCILDSVSLNENNVPDGGPTAVFLYSIDGRESEVVDPTLENSLDTFAPEGAALGDRRRRSDRYSDAVGR